jgi:hypothetical protein
MTIKMKTLVQVGIVLSALTACGGLAGNEEPFEQEHETVEQSVTYIPAYGFRSDLSDSNTRCNHNTTVSGHTCNYPPNKALTLRCTGTGMTAAQKTVCEQKLDGFIAAFSGEMPSWNITRVNSGNADVMISYGANTSSNPTTSIHRYARATVSGATTLNDFGATGTYQKYGTVNCTVDRARIVADTTGTQQDRVLGHALHFCAWKGAGVGSGGAANRSYSIAVTPDTNKSQNMSAMVACMVETYDPTTQPSDVFPVCGDVGGLIIPCNCAGLTDN